MTTELPEGGQIFQVSFIDDGQGRGWTMLIVNKKRVVAPRLGNIEIRRADSYLDAIQKANEVIAKAAYCYAGIP